MLPLLLCGLVLFLAGCGIHAGNFYNASRHDQEMFCKAHGKELNINLKTQTVNGCASAEEKEALTSEYILCQAETMADPAHPHRFVGGWNGPLNLQYQCMSEAEFLAYKQREATLQAARMQADAVRQAAKELADAALIGTIISGPTSVRQPTMPRQTNCISQHSGNSSYTTCY